MPVLGFPVQHTSWLWV